MLYCGAVFEQFSRYIEHKFSYGFTVFWFLWFTKSNVSHTHRIKKKPHRMSQNWIYKHENIYHSFGTYMEKRRAGDEHYAFTTTTETSSNFLYILYLFIFFFFVRCPRHLPDSLFCISNKPIWQIKIADVFYAELTVIFFSISLNGKEGGCLHNNSYVSAVTFVEPRTQQKIKKKKCSRPRQCILPRG